MLPTGELEYSSIIEKVQSLDEHFIVRGGETTESAFRYAASR